MNLKSWVRLSFFLLFSLYYVDNQAQNFSVSYQIPWEKPRKVQISETETIEFLSLENAVFDNVFSHLPLFLNKISVDNFFSSYNIVVNNVKKSPFSDYERTLIPENFDQSDLQIHAVTQIENKKSFLILSFIPIVKNNQGVYEKIVSCDITISGILSPDKNLGQSKNYAQNSVLASGTWYKFSVSQSGIHKITYDDLQSLGVPLSNLSSSHFAVFGNGGGMLPEYNGTSRNDDLQELPIRIVDGNDGSFNENDYILFYAQGPHTWSYNDITRKFSHQYNVYSDVAIFFLTIDPAIGEKKRISTIDNTSLSANITASTFTHYQFYENDVLNFGESGRNWFDNGFDMNTQKEYSFTIPTLTSNGAKMTILAATNSSLSSYFDVTANGTTLSRMYLTPPVGSDLVNTSIKNYTLSTLSSPLKINLTYNKPQASSIAYLDWIELQADCELSQYSGQFPFCNIDNVGTGNVSEYRITGANSQTTVWNITNPLSPVQIKGILNNATFSFKNTTEQIQYFVAYNGSLFYSITPIGLVANQNLHGNSLSDMIIVTHPDFLTQAERLAKFRREQDQLSVRVVTIQQVYNEFSSGAQDPTAIRDYMKMIYDKSNGAFPRYLLLFGRPSYDYRGRVEGTSIYVPNYQLNTEISESSFRAFDDYFALLDTNEGTVQVSGNYTLRGLFDIAVGRFPVTTASQAEIAVTKTLNYSAKYDLLNSNSTQISNFADWRNMIVYVADDEDSNWHVESADASATILSSTYPTMNIDKIYCDAYRQVSSAGGQRYPEVTEAINNRMNRGALVFNYVGHGSGASWAHERILEASDINSWKNKYNQPLVVTLTCEFGWYDRKSTSPAELMFLNPNGGAAAMITTARVAFTGDNDTYARTLAAHILSPIDNRNVTMGEINKITKNAMGGVRNHTCMIYTMGDPSMPINLPRYKIVTDSVNGHPLSQIPDTLKALSKVTITGRVTDDDGNTMNAFNGNVYPTIYDKQLKIKTLQNDQNTDPFEFYQQKSMLFKGNASVNNGFFSFSFIVPKDINYVMGNGKISYYAKTQNSDAAGYSNQIIIGGFSDNPIVDNKGPELDLFLNDESFVSGGITNANPVLILKLKDEFGINTTGNGIGHDLTATIDGKTENQILLNDFYQASKDSFNCGTVRYNLESLEEGLHTLKVRAWDIANNYSETEIEFKVVTDSKLMIDHVLNYPNPFTTHTDFYFEHNQAESTFDILVSIFTISGKLVKTIASTQFLTGNRSEAISWDGRDDYGDKLGKGVYIYKLSVRNDSGELAEKIEKIVIL